MTEYTKDFERFWLEYPKRHKPGDSQRPSNPKFPSYKAWLKAIKVAPPEVIIDSLEGYKNSLGDRLGTPFVCQCTTYLNQRRWEDYPPGEVPAPQEQEAPAAPDRQELFAAFGSTDYNLWFKEAHILDKTITYATEFRRKYVEQQYGPKLRGMGFVISETLSGRQNA